MEDPAVKPTIKERVKLTAKKNWFSGLSIASFGAWFVFEPEMVKDLFTEAMQHEITRMTVAFIIAWKIVKRDMKRDMGEEFTALRFEISKLGEGFAKVGEDLKFHAGRLDKLDEIVQQLKGLYEKLIGGK